MLANVTHKFGHVTSSPFDPGNDGSHDVLAEKLFRRIAEEGVCEAIGEGEIALGVHPQDNPADAFDQFAVSVLASLEFRLQVDTLGIRRIERRRLFPRFRMIFHGRPPRSPR
jgi:hypothetical protein